MPPDLWRKMHMKVGLRLDWQTTGQPDEILLRIVMDRGQAARNLLGTGASLLPERDAVADLVAERYQEDN